MTQSSIAGGLVGRSVGTLLVCLLSLSGCGAGKRPVLSLLAGGDCLFDRGEPRAYGADDPRLEALAAAARSNDAFLFNLETTIGSGGTPKEKPFVFRSPALALTPLRALRRPVVGLANNHSMDYGAAGLRSTLEALDAAGIDYAGAGEDLDAALSPAVLDIVGTKLLVFSLGVDNEADSFARSGRPGIAPLEPRLVAERIAAARIRHPSHGPETLVVVVMVHWGTEYMTLRDPRQWRVARSLVDAGADLVVGSGPHVLQGIEWYRNSPILYSLGNLVFDDIENEETTAGLLVRFRVYASENGNPAKRLWIAPLRTSSAAEGPRSPEKTDALEIAHGLLRRSPSSIKLGNRRSEDGLFWFEVMESSQPSDSGITTVK